MKINELIINIEERYQMPKLPDDNQRARDIYRKDFGFYSESKLDKVWYAIKRHHKNNFAPNYSAIVDCMDKAGIGESRETGKDNFYSRCTELIPARDYGGKHMKDSEGDLMFVECGTKYSLNSKFCPECNRSKNISKPLMNTRVVVKCDVLPGDLRVLNELCGTCKAYQNNPFVKGAKCNAWNCHDEYRKASKDCKNCPCIKCCNEKAMNGVQRDTIDMVKGLVKGVDSTRVDDHVE